MTNAYHTIQSSYTVRVDLTEVQLLKQMEELFQKEKN